MHFCVLDWNILIEMTWLTLNLTNIYRQASRSESGSYPIHVVVQNRLYKLTARNRTTGGRPGPGREAYATSRSLFTYSLMAEKWAEQETQLGDRTYWPPKTISLFANLTSDQSFVCKIATNTADDGAAAVADDDDDKDHGLVVVLTRPPQKKTAAKTTFAFVHNPRVWYSKRAYAMKSLYMYMCVCVCLSHFYLTLFLRSSSICVCVCYFFVCISPFREQMFFRATRIRSYDRQFCCVCVCVFASLW